MTKIPVNMPGFAPNLPISATKTKSATNDADFSQIFANQKNTGSVEADFADKVSEEPEDMNTNRVEDNSKSEEAATLNNG